MIRGLAWRIRAFLWRRWLVQHDLTPEQVAHQRPADDHQFHWILDCYGGGPQPCCQYHSDEIDRQMRAQSVQRPDRRDKDDLTRGEGDWRREYFARVNGAGPRRQDLPELQREYFDRVNGTKPRP
jgi:hypothetical protein